MHTPYTEVKLSNGLPVLLVQQDSPAAATYWWINTGSVDEAPKEAGFAHFLEHMLFKDAGAKDTGQASSGQIARAIESLGGDINAYTSLEQTVYHFTCGEVHWERVIDAFGEMVRPQAFLKQDFVREREVILEEMRRGNDTPSRQLWERLFALAFPKHPYGRSVIGFSRTLKAAKVGELERFYRRGYVTGRMGVVLVGPIGPADGARAKKLLAAVERRFGKKVFPTRVAPDRAYPKYTIDHKTPKFEIQPFDVQSPTLSLAFRIPGVKHDDTAALDTLGGVLGAGELCRLYQALYYTRKLVTEVSSGTYSLNHGGIFYVQVEAETLEKLDLAIEPLFAELEKIRSESPAEDELRRIVVNQESERLYATQSVDGMASRMGSLRFGLGDLSLEDRYLEELRGLKPDQISAIAGKYLVHGALVGVLQVPKNAKEDPAALSIRKRVLEGGAKLLAPGEHAGTPGTHLTRGVIHRTKVPSGIVPEVERRPSGLTVVRTERKNSPVFSVVASVLGGARLEPVPGSSMILAQILAKGTESKTSQTVARLVENSAAKLDGFSGRNTLGLECTGLARDWAMLSDLFVETLSTPRLDQSELELVKKVTVDAIRSIEDHSSSLLSKLFLETLYDGHPLGRYLRGNIPAVEKLERSLLEKTVDEWIHPSRLVVAISGPIGEVEYVRFVEKLEAALQGRTLIQPPALPAVGALVAPRWVERKLSREQVHVEVGGFGPDYTSKDRYAMRVLDAVLEGQSGRLFIELREKKSLAYSVAPVGSEGIESGWVGTYIGCGQGKEQEALKGIAAVYESLAKKGPTAAEMKRAIEYRLGQKAMGLQSDAAIATTTALQTLYGFDLAEELDPIRWLKRVRAEDVKRACARYLVDAPQVTALVG